VQCLAAELVQEWRVPLAMVETLIVRELVLKAAGG
jgi:hypothetical protein